MHENKSFSKRPVANLDDIKWQDQWFRQYFNVSCRMSLHKLQHYDEHIIYSNSYFSCVLLYSAYRAAKSVVWPIPRSSSWYWLIKVRFHHWSHGINAHFHRVNYVSPLLDSVGHVSYRHREEYDSKTANTASKLLT